MDQKVKQKYNKIIKVTLIIYCLIMAICMIVFGMLTITQKNNSYLCGFSLCLGPGLMFVFISMMFPIIKIVDAKVGKSTIAWYVVAYVLKYAAIIGIPFIGIYKPDIFNKWVMLATTLIGPIFVYTSKLIIANVVSKSAKNQEK